MGSSGKMSIPLSPQPSSGNNQLFSRGAQIPQDRVRRFTLNQGSHRNGYNTVFASFPVLSFPLPVSSRLGFVVSHIAKINQGFQTLIGNKNNIPSFTAIPSIRPAPGDKFLTSETYAATSAITRSDSYACFINKSH
jgi:hypothetical protein